MPRQIPQEIKHYLREDANKQDMCEAASRAYRSICNGKPLISIVMPAYNESENIVVALSSLCNNKTDKSVEIIVVDNNSIDDTEKLITACGVTCINEPRQGITYARNAGLNMARGIYVLNADADVVYPEDWIDEMINPLIKYEKIALTYGLFSFIPIGNTGRNIYFIYEFLSGISRWYNTKAKDEAVNVYGFNSGFRRSQGISVGGFNHPPGTNEDGWLAVKLRNKGYGRLYCVRSRKARVWTTDRRIQMDGGLYPGILIRLKRIFNLR